MEELVRTRPCICLLALSGMKASSGFTLSGGYFLSPSKVHEPPLKTIQGRCPFSKASLSCVTTSFAHRLQSGSPNLHLTSPRKIISGFTIEMSTSVCVVLRSCHLSTNSAAVSGRKALLTLLTCNGPALFPEARQTPRKFHSPAVF